MRLVEMHIRNFMRFKRATLQLADCGMTLIEGVNKDDESATSNGAGKSTLVDALVWCLYGVTTHEPSADGDDVVNETHTKDCEVRVSFVVSDEMYDVTRRRAWTKGGKPVQLLFEYTNVGAETRQLTRGTIRDTQVAIEQTIGMGVATFRHACVFGQGRAYRFSRLTDTEKKAVLDEMLGSEVYAKAGSKASERLTEVEKELVKAENSLHNATETRQYAQSRLDKLTERRSKAKQQGRAERETAKREVANISKQLSEMGVLNVEAGRLAAAKARAVLDKATDEMHTAKRFARACTDRLHDLEANRKKLLKLEETECLTCKQHVPKKHVSRLLRVLDEDIEIQNGLDASALSDLEAKQKDVETQTRAVEKAVRAYNDAREHMQKHDELDSKLRAAKTRLAALSEREDDLLELIDEERQRITKLRNKETSCQDQIAQLKTQIDNLKFWQDGFSTKGLRSLMLDSSLPYLNAKLEQYTNALTAGNIVVEFKTQRELKGGGTREEFYIDVRNKHGASRYNMNSIGERAKIDIIVGLALQDMAASRSRVPVNVAFFDEVFDGLDDRGIDRAVQTLSQLKRESAFVISHKAELKTFFSRRITVVKENGESRLES